MFLLIGLRKNFPFVNPEEQFVPSNFFSFDMYSNIITNVEIYGIRNNKKFNLTSLYESRNWPGQRPLMTNALNTPWNRGIRFFGCSKKFTNNNFDYLELNYSYQIDSRLKEVKHLVKCNLD